MLPEWLVGVVAFGVLRDNAADKFNFKDDCDGDLERQFEGVAVGDDAADEVDELNEAAKLCKLNDFDNLEFRRESRVTYNVW